MNLMLLIRRKTEAEEFTVMNKKAVIQKIICAVTVVLTVAIDFVTKKLAVQSLGTVGESKTVIEGFLDFTYVLNSGATAGMLSDKRWVFMSVSAVVIIVALGYLFLSKRLTAFTAFSVSVIVGGGIGNMIDRCFYGKVVDFIDVTAVDFFPFNTVFNVADIFVCVGCGLLILAFILDEARESEEKKKTAEQKEENKENTEQ